MRRGPSGPRRICLSAMCTNGRHGWQRHAAYNRAITVDTAMGGFRMPKSTETIHTVHWWISVYQC